MARSAADTTARSICTQTKVPVSSPSRESQLLPQRVRPGDSRRCINRVKSRNQRSIQQMRNTELRRGEVNQRTIATVTTRVKSRGQSVAAKASTTSNRHDRTFTRGSSLCRNVCPDWKSPFSVTAINSCFFHENAKHAPQGFCSPPKQLVSAGKSRDIVRTHLHFADPANRNCERSGNSCGG